MYYRRKVLYEYRQFTSQDIAYLHIYSCTWHYFYSWKNGNSKNSNAKMII
jgi:hypothetical protein